MDASGRMPSLRHPLYVHRLSFPSFYSITITLLLTNVLTITRPSLCVLIDHTISDLSGEKRGSFPLEVG